MLFRNRSTRQLSMQWLQISHLILLVHVTQPLCLCAQLKFDSHIAGAMEQVLGLLAALTLRNPSAAVLAVEAGCIDAVLEVMKVCSKGVHGKLGQWVQRQACMGIRNVVARNPELRPVVLEKGAEPLLRQAKKMFPQSCGDVGSAALRDLDIADYNS